jgi:hypothetical protein
MWYATTLKIHLYEGCNNINSIANQFVLSQHWQVFIHWMRVEKCKLCQNNPNANLIHIVIMPSTYCINDHINVESSTYSHQFDDLLMYVVPMLVIFFHWFNIDKMSNVLVLYQCHFKTCCYNVTLTSYQWLYQHWTLNILLRCCKSTRTKRGQVCDVMLIN